MHQVKKPFGPILNALSVVAVSCYLIFVLIYLLFTKKLVVSAPFSSLFWSKLRRPYCANLRIIHPDQGHCFSAPVPVHLLSDQQGYSRLVVFEDGIALPRPHRTHDEIRKIGAGAFSHWGHYVFFSSLDNSNPVNNGRLYSVREV